MEWGTLALERYCRRNCGFYIWW